MQAHYMTYDESQSRPEIVAAELRALGLTLRSLPGEYCVNFRNGGEKTARMADDLDQALELGRAMAAEKAVDQATEKPPRRRWRRKRMTPKARRRRFILGHNRRFRRRALRKRRGKRQTSAKSFVAKRPRGRR
jgi:hypothetical protein